MRYRLRLIGLAGLMAALLASATVPGTASAQKTPDKTTPKTPEKTPEKTAEKGKEKFDNVSFLTVDGLRLFGIWYNGGKGRSSDVVIMLPNWKKSYADRGDWNTLAEELQKEGYSVLIFDFRGHGKSKSQKSFEDASRYVQVGNYPWNKLAGISSMTNPAGLKGLDVAKFNPNIYPYLVNDIAAARKFVDNRNDAGECNSGRINIIADQAACSLGMAWIGTEFQRVAIYQRTTMDIAPQNHYGSKDLLAAVWLSYRTGPGATNSIINAAIQNDNVAREVVKDKISMAFVYGDADKDSMSMAKQWFGKWGAKAPDEPRLGKYMIEVKNGKTLAGIDLCDPTKNLDTVSQIVAFLKGAQKKQLAGGDWVLRNAGSDPPFRVPLDTAYGLKNP